MLVLPIIAFSKWNVTVFKKDELAGVPDYRAFTYSEDADDEQFIVYDTPDMQIKVICPKYSFFNSKGDWKEFPFGGYSGQEFCIAKVGFYKNGKLVKSGRMPIFIREDKSQFGFIHEPKFAGMSDAELKKKFISKRVIEFAKIIRDTAASVKKVEIYNALCTDGMSVRIIAPRYGKSDYDLTIPADERFKSISWIPVNRERVLIEMREKAEAEKAARLEKEKEEAMKIKLVRIKVLEEKYSNLVSRAERCRKNGYTFSLKKIEPEMKVISEELIKLKKEN